MRTFITLAALVTAQAAGAQTLIVGNKAEHSISFIDLRSGQEAMRRETGRAPHELAVSPDGRTAVAVSYREQGFAGDTLHLFDVASAKQVGTIALPGHKGLHGLKWVGRGNHVLVTSEVTRNIALVDVARRSLLASIPTAQDGSHMVAVASDGRRAYVSNIGSGSVSVIDLARRAKVRDIAVGAGAEAITLSPDGRQLWVGANDARSVSIFDTRTLRRTASFSTEGVPIRIEFSPDGRHVAISEPDRDRVLIVDSRSRKEIARIALGAEARAPVTMLFSPDGRRLWVAATGSAAVVEIGTGDWKITRRMAAGKGADGLAFSPLSVALAR